MSKGPQFFLGEWRGKGGSLHQSRSNIKCPTGILCPTGNNQRGQQGHDEGFIKIRSIYNAHTIHVARVPRRLSSPMQYACGT